MAYIYTLEHPVNSEIRYIGVTIRTLQSRLYDHCSSYYLKKVNNRRATWIKSLKKQNLKPIIKLLDEVPYDKRYETEMFYIEQFKQWGFDLVNSTKGGSGGTTYVRPKFYHKEETKLKISKANTRSHSTEWIANAAKGAFKPITQYTLDGIILKNWDSTTTAALALGDINYKKNISSCLRGLRNHAYGFKWEYKTIDLQDKEPVG
jgi:hypothetical protein